MIILFYLIYVLINELNEKTIYVGFNFGHTFSDRSLILTHRLQN